MANAFDQPGSCTKPDAKRMTTHAVSNTAALSIKVDHPGLGRPGRLQGTRELVAHRNYILIYDVAGDLVRVLRILHAARQWPPVRH